MTGLLSTNKVAGFRNSIRINEKKLMSDTIVLNLPGTTCLSETVEAFLKLGHEVRAVENLRSAEFLVIPGGFAHGDADGPGKIAARKLQESLLRFPGRILGICNGFQILVEAGLLRGVIDINAGGRFECEMRGVVHLGVKYSIPIAHKFGRYVGDARSLITYEDTNEIAGVSSDNGRIIGIMPHPERAVDKRYGSEDGLPLLRAILRSVS